MSTLKKILIPFIAICILSSCRKTNESLISQRIPSLLDVNGSYNNFVAITCSQLANIIDTVNSFDIVASAGFTSDGAAVNAGPIIINGRLITADSNNIYEYKYKENNTLAEGKSLLGASIDVAPTEARGQRLMGSETIVMPKALFSSTSHYPKSTINKAIPLPIDWQPDPNNQYQKVSIEIYYYKGISQLYHPEMPNSVASLFYQVTDNGSFTVPKADLNRFPEGAYIGFSISRAFYFNPSGNFAYIAVTEGHSVPILVTYSAD